MLKLGSRALLLLPPELRHSRQAWLLLASAILALGLASPVVVLRLQAGATILGLIPLIVAVTLALGTLALLWTRRELFAGAVTFLIGMAVLIPATAFLGDGVGAMTLPTVAVVPMCAFFILGPVAGRNAVGVVTTVLAAAVLAVWFGGLRFPVPTTHRLDELFTLGASFALVWVTYAVIATYHHQQSVVVRALRASEARYALAIRAERAGIVEWTADAGECFTSPRLRSLLRLPEGPDSASTSALLAALTPPHAAALAAAMAGALGRPGEPFRLETEVPIPGLPPRWLVWDGLAEATIQGRQRVVAVVRDISQERHVAQLKDDFVGNVNHELRTPLTNILGAVALLRAGVGGPVEPEGVELLELAQRNGVQLTSLIGELLDVQRLEEGALAIHPVDVDVVAVCRGVVAELMGFAAQRGVTVVLARAEPCPVTTDPRRLAQVLKNLIHNASKFSPAGTAVHVRVRAVATGVRVEVVDAGPGIPDEFHPYIFGRFSQAWSGTSRPQAGTGLGLSLARALMERLGGAIGFVSMPGEGACFWVEVPR